MLGYDMMGTYFLLPLFAISRAVRNPNLSIEVRFMLIKVAFTVFFWYVQHFSECGRPAGISEKTWPSCPRKTFWTQSMGR
jgi:hypothetical protein